jgi:hypothetical protein
LHDAFHVFSVVRVGVCNQSKLGQVRNA